MRELQELRGELDGLDRELTALLERRLALAREIARAKAQRGLPVRDAAREAQVLSSRRAWLKDPALGDACDRFFEGLMALSRQVQEEEMRNA